MIILDKESARELGEALLDAAESMDDGMTDQASVERLDGRYVSVSGESHDGTIMLVIDKLKQHP